MKLTLLIIAALVCCTYAYGGLYNRVLADSRSGNCLSCIRKCKLALLPAFQEDCYSLMCVKTCSREAGIRTLSDTVAERLVSVLAEE